MKILQCMLVYAGPPALPCTGLFSPGRKSKYQRNIIEGGDNCSIMYMMHVRWEGGSYWNCIPGDSVCMIITVIPLLVNTTWWQPWHFK